MRSLESFIIGQGWTDYGIVSAEQAQAALTEHQNRFDDWVSRGFSADMDYLIRMRQDRFDLGAKLPGVQSAIVLSAWYAEGEGAEEGGGIGGSADEVREAIGGAPFGVVARYARRRDYHKVLKKKAEELGEHLQSADSSVVNYVSVDSGPTVDRVMAETAGLGFFGTNSSIIHPSRGSWFFIAVLLTTARLEPTGRRPMPGCGNCTRCRDACPTGAIVEPGVVDSRRCISYLTIENRGVIPGELRGLVGNRLFGCDACQECCPFNIGRAHCQKIGMEGLECVARRGAGESVDTAAVRVVELAGMLSLREMLSMDEAAFLERFSGTPVMRAKWRGFLRNACVAAGNSGDKSLLPALQDLASSCGDDMIAEHARWAADKLSEL